MRWLFLCLLLSPWGLFGDKVESISVEAFSMEAFSMEELMNMEVKVLSGVSENLDESIGTVYSFSADTIEKRGFRSLKDLLQTVPGFTVFHKDLNFVTGVRGLAANDNEKVTLMINGHEVNSVQEPDYLNGPINLTTLERVEVVVGPSSFFQQANTLTATVNLITKEVEGVEASVATGNDLVYSLNALWGKKWSEDKKLNLSFTYEEKQGFDAYTPENITGIGALPGREVTGELRPSFFGVLTGQYDTLSVQFSSYQSRYPELFILAGGNNNGENSDNVHSLILQNESDLTDDLTAIITGEVAYKRTRREQKDGLPLAGGLEKTESQIDSGLDLELRYTGVEDHFIQTGVQFSYEYNYDSYLKFSGDPIPFEKRELYDDNTYAFGFYVSDTWQVSEVFKVVSAVRADQNTISRESQSQFYPGGRLGLVWNINPRWTSKVMLNRAVRMPSPIAGLNEFWGLGNNPAAPAWASQSPNAERPEIATTIEWQNVFYLDQSRLSLTIYHQEVEDFITWGEPHTNVGDFSGQGVEAEIQHDFNENVMVWWNMSYINSEFDALTPELTGFYANDAGELMGAPEFTSNLGLELNYNQKYFLAPTVRYFTRQTARSYVNNEFIKIDDQFYVDLTFTAKDVIKKDVDFQLIGQNIFDNRDVVSGHWLAGSYKPRGASITAVISMKF